MRKINRKNPDNLLFQSRTIFVGNTNEIWYYLDSRTGRHYARARFEHSDTLKTWLLDEWWQISSNEVKDEDAQRNIEIEINKYFGYFNFKTTVF